MVYEFLNHSAISWDFWVFGKVKITNFKFLSALTRQARCFSLGLSMDYTTNLIGKLVILTIKSYLRSLYPK